MMLVPAMTRSQPISTISTVDVVLPSHIPAAAVMRTDTQARNNVNGSAEDSDSKMSAVKLWILARARRITLNIIMMLFREDAPSSIMAVAKAAGIGLVPLKNVKRYV